MAQVLCPVVVGHRDARRGVDDVVAAARRGAGHVTALVGDAGWGKSRLVRAGVVRARADGLVVLVGHASGDRTPEPYRPLVEAVVGALRETGPPTSDRLRPFRGALARFVPSWADAAGTPTSSVLVAEGFLTLLRVLAEDRGALLVVDDVHHADPETLDVLDHVVEALPTAGVSVLLSTRTRPAAVVERVRRWTRRADGEVCELAPLTADETADMARACLGTDDLPAALPGLLARTDGVPLKVEEVLAAAIDREVLTRDGSGWRMRPGAATAVPATVAELVADRLDAMAEPARRVIAAAALLGARFDGTVLPAALPGADVLAALREGAAAGLLTLVDGAFRFRHSLLADAVPCRLVDAERRDLATALLAELGVPATATSAEPWATLFELAGRPSDAAEHLVAAGHHALDTGSLGSARALGERALALGDPHDAAADLLLAEASACGDVDRAERFGAGSDTGRRHLLLATAALAAGRWPMAATHLEAALARSVTGPQRDRALALRAQVHLEHGRLDEAERDARRVIDAAGAADAADAVDPETACHAVEVLGRLARLADPDGARSWFEALYGRADDADLPLWRLRALHQLATLQLRDTMRTDGSIRARDEAARMGARARVATLDLEIAVNQAATFRPGDGREAVERCVARARRDRLGLLPEALSVRAHLSTLAGDHEAAQLDLAEAEALGLDDEQRSIVAARCHGLGALLAEDRSRATACFAEAMASVARRSGALARPYFVLWPVLAELADRDGGAARDLVRTRAGGVGCIAAGVDLAEAVAAGRHGDLAAAEAAFARGEALLAPYGERVAGYHQMLRRLVAQSALEHGWGSPAEWFREAGEYFRSTGHRPVEDACRTGLRACGAPVPRRYRRSSTVPTALRRLGVTEREAEVLSLLADGRTNSAIAAALVISTRTVDKHVERLLAKTGASDRAALRSLVHELVHEVVDHLVTERT